MSSQLWRAVLAKSTLSEDQQDAAPDDRGSYGELMEAIDEIVADPEDRKAPKASRSRRSKKSG